MFGRFRCPGSFRLCHVFVVVTAVIGVGSCARGGDREELQCLATCRSGKNLKFDPPIRQPGNYVFAIGSSRCAVTLPAVLGCLTRRDGAAGSPLPAKPARQALYLQIQEREMGSECAVRFPTTPACLTLGDVLVGNAPMPLPRTLHVTVTRDGEEVINGDAELETYKPYEVCGVKCAHADFRMPVPPGPLRSF